MNSSLASFNIFIRVLFLTLILIFIVSKNAYSIESCNIVAGYGDEKPYHFTISDGSIVGIDADILRTVLNDVGCSISFVELPWKRTLNMIRQGNIDVTLGASLKKERTEFAHYSIPYRGQPHVVFDKQKTSSGINTLEEYLKSGKTVGIINGWHYTDKIQSILQNPVYADQILTANEFKKALKMHDLNRFDGLLTNPSLLASEIGKQKMYDRYQMIKADIDILHFIFSKNSVDGKLVEEFNRKLEARIQGGLFMKICRKYENMLISTCLFLSTTK